MRSGIWTMLAATATTVLMLAAFGAGCDRGGGGNGKSGEPSTSSASPSGAKRIAVIPKGTTHVCWKSVEAGARKAADEAGVEMIWKGPLREDDRYEQIKVVEQFTSE